MSVLDVRLGNMERHLRQAQDPRRWFTQLVQGHGVAENLWEFAFEKIQDEAGDLEAEIEDLRERLRGGAVSEQDAWRSYQGLRVRSESVLRECLDLLGGLALRDRATDDQICQLADDLIYECAQPSFKMLATVPALVGDGGDSLTSTLRRVASVRFPDWSLWTVPLVADEYGYVMTEVEEVLRSYVTAQATAYLGAGDPAAAAGASPEDLRLRAERRARVLVADAFATYAMGPAYACSALLLRLDPAVGRQRYRPADAARAEMVLGVLAAMDEDAMGAYADVRGFLAAQWEQTCALSPPPQAPGPDVVAPDGVARYLRRKFHYRSTGYTPEGWADALQWASEWRERLEDPRPLQVPAGLHKGHSLRDALNAVWACRTWIMRNVADPAQRDAKVGQLEAVGRQLCEQVLKKRRSGAGKSLPKATRAGLRSDA